MTLVLSKELDSLTPIPVPSRRRSRSGKTASSIPGSSAILPLSSPDSDPNFLAHDAHNWLTVLQVYCDLLRTSGVVAIGHQRWVEELSKAIQRGHGLVASLLDSAHTATSGAHAEQANRGEFVNFSKPGKTVAAPIPAAPLDIVEAVARRLPLLQHLAGKNIHVDIDARSYAGQVAMPEIIFERILHNLVSNAIEAMPEGGQLQIAVQHADRSECKPRRVRRGRDNAELADPAEAAESKFEVRVQPDPIRSNPPLPERRSERRSKSSASNRLLLRVSDTGSGIQPDRLLHIFEPGVTSKPEDERKQPHGMGLAIVRELTELAGGSIRVQTRPGHGSSFEIELPCI